MFSAGGLESAKFMPNEKMVTKYSHYFCREEIMHTVEKGKSARVKYKILCQTVCESDCVTDFEMCEIIHSVR